MTTTLPRRPSSRPVPTRPTHVAVEFTRTSAAQLARIVPPAGTTRAQLAELARLEGRVLDHLARNPAARPAMLADPASVWRAAVPDAPAALLARVGAAHAAATRIPARLDPARFTFGVEGRVPVPALPAPQPTAAPNGLGGFDACLAVGADALGAALAGLLGPVLGPAAGRRFELPLVGSLEVQAPAVRPGVVLGGEVVTVTADAGAVFTALGLVPVAVTVTIEIDLRITAEGGQLLVDATDVRVQVEPLPDAIDALLGLLADAVRAVFPIAVPVDLPGGAGEGLCDIGPRELGVAVLAGSAATQPCLGVFLGLLPDPVLDLGGLASPLPAGEGGGLFLDNFFLLTQVACEIQHLPQLAGKLPAEPTHRPVRTSAAAEQFVSWEGLTIEQTVENDRGKPEELLITRIAVRIVADPVDPRTKRFDVAVGLRIERSLFTVDVDLHVPISVDLVDGEIVALIGEPTHSVTVRFTLLGHLVGAALVLAGVVVGAIVGGLHGAVAGGAIAGSVVAALALLVVVLVRRTIANAIGDLDLEAPPGRRVVPQAIVDLFGVLDVGRVLFDDLELTGTLTLAEPGIELTQRRLATKSTHVGGGVVHLATPVRFEAVPRRLTAPVSHQWRFTRRSTGRPDKGTVLSTGGLPPGTGIGDVVADGDTCRITNAPGSDVDGVVSVRATDAAGRTFTRSVPLQLTGSITVPLDELPGGKPDPLFPDAP